MAEMTATTDPVLEAIARKLHGIERVPPIEQAAMICRAAAVARESARREVAEQIITLLDGIDREEIYGGGWWETSEAAECGARILQKIRALTGGDDG